MELVNSKYIKIDRFDIFGRIVQVAGNDDYSFNLNSLIYDYSKENKTFIKEVYINKEESSLNKIIDLNNIPIKRSTIRNAIIFAGLSSNEEFLIKLNSILYKNEVYPFELEEELLNYILENSIDIDEYFGFELPRIIYNEEQNKIEEGYIYKEKEFVNKKKLQKN